MRALRAYRWAVWEMLPLLGEILACIFIGWAVLAAYFKFF